MVWYNYKKRTGSKDVASSGAVGGGGRGGGSSTSEKSRG